MQDFFDVVSVEKLGWFIISQGILKRHRLFRDYDPSMWSFAERKMSVLNSMSEMTNEDVRLNLDV